MKYIHPVISNIMARESCHQFKPDKVDREDIETLLLAASYAPNAGGRQPWAFSVVTNEDILNSIADESHREFLEMAEKMKDRPEPKPGEISDKHAGEFKRGGMICGREGFPPMLIIISEVPEMTPGAACYMAAENIMLAAKAIGLDSLCMGAINANVIQRQIASPDCPPEIRQLVPEGYNVICTIGVGYADWNAFRAPRLPRRDDVVYFFE
jgi:nitroreductase